MENSFLVYYWLAPAFWIFVTITNRILGTFIAKLNQKTVGVVPSSNEGQWGVVYIIRLVLFIPLIIYFWWLSTKVLALNEIYLLVAGYQLLLWTTAVIRQLASLLSHYLFRKFQLEPVINENNLPRIQKLQSITSAGDYFNYFLIYLIITILTQSWFIAGGTLSCLVNVIRNINRAQNSANIQSGTSQSVKEPEA